MKLVIVTPKKDVSSWVKSLKQQESDLKVEVYPEDTEREKTEFILTWSPPETIFKEFPNLKVLASMGAGVNHITKLPNIPKDLVITKVNDPLLRTDMATYVLTQCLSHLRRLPEYFQQQQEQNWNELSYRRPEDTRVGIMGIGTIGQTVGELLVKNNFQVSGWSHSEKDLEKIKTFAGKDSFPEFLKPLDIVVCLLPLTAKTKGILNKDVFNQLSKNAYLINVARGGHLVEKDLLEALENEQLAGAALDVFSEEPLPKRHPFWKQPKITLTPHTASVTDPKSVSKTVLENLKRLKEGEPLKDTVNLKKGY